MIGNHHVGASPGVGILIMFRADLMAGSAGLSSDDREPLILELPRKSHAIERKESIPRGDRLRFRDITRCRMQATCTSPLSD